MIKYELICKSCDLSFDSWFASSQEYEKLRNKNFLSCISCNSNKVEKNLMSPKLIKRASKEVSDKKNLKIIEFDKKIKEYQKFIKNNFNYVGKNFAYEARSIHYDSHKNKKGIYGLASSNEIKELREEGIEAEMLTWINDKNN